MRAQILEGRTTLSNEQASAEQAYLVNRLYPARMNGSTTRPRSKSDRAIAMDNLARSWIQDPEEIDRLRALAESTAANIQHYAPSQAVRRTRMRTFIAVDSAAEASVPVPRAGKKQQRRVVLDPAVNSNV